MITVSCLRAGDGTLLWTCHVFGNRAVPPLLPFSMGSLGFLTPFSPSEVDAKLQAVLDGEWPAWLVHLFYARIPSAVLFFCGPDPCSPTGPVHGRVLAGDPSHTACCATCSYTL